MLDKFVSELDKGKKMLELIHQHYDDHFGETPETVNWASVGTVQESNRILRELCTFLDLHDWEYHQVGGLDFVAGEVLDNQKVYLRCTICDKMKEVDKPELSEEIPF